MVSSNLHSSRLENRCWAVVLNVNDRLARSLPRAILSLARTNVRILPRESSAKPARRSTYLPRRVYASGHERVRSTFPPQAREARAYVRCGSFFAFIDMDGAT